MKPRTAILLTVLLVMIVAAILIRSGYEAARPDQVPPGGKSIWPGKPGKVKQLAIHPDAGEEIRFLHDGEKWRITAPIEAPANTYRVEGIVDPLKELAYQASFEPGDPDAPGAELTGLDKPRWKLTLTDEDGRDYVLKVGRPVPLSGGRKTYVQPGADRRTYVVEVDLAGKLDRPLTDFRDQAVLALDTDRIVKVSLTGRQKIELARKAGLWRITAPVAARAQDDEVNKLLAKFANLRAAEFVDDAPASLGAYGLAPGTERLVVRVWVQAEQPATDAASQPTTRPAESYALALGSKTRDKRYAKLLDSPSVFLVQEHLLEDLQVTLADLRDRQMLPLSPDDVLRVEVETASGLVDLIRQGEGWKMVQPYHGPANAQAVGNLLSKINDLEAESFQDSGGPAGMFGLDRPKATITLHQVGRKDKLRLLIGAESPSGEMTFLRCGPDGVIGAVKTTEVKKLLADPAGYFDTTMIDLPEEAQPVKLTLKRPHQRLVLTKADGQWRMVEPVEAEVDQDNLDKLLDKLRHLKARKIVAVGPAVPKRYAKAAGRIGITLEAVAAPASQPTTSTSKPATMPSPKRYLYELQVAKIGLTSYVWPVAGEPVAVGRLHSSVYDALTAELRNRTIWKIDPESVENIKLVAGNDTLELVRSGKSWSCTADAYVRIDPGKVASFLKDISRIEAERFAGYLPPDGAASRKFGLTKPWFTLTLSPTEGASRQITVAGKGPERQKSRYALASSVQGTLVISSKTAGKMAVKLADFKQ